MPVMLIEFTPVWVPMKTMTAAVIVTMTMAMAVVTGIVIKAMATLLATYVAISGTVVITEAVPQTICELLFVY